MGLRPVDGTWTQTSTLQGMGLGSRDCAQVVPVEASLATIDAPDMRVQLTPEAEPAWAYLAGPAAWPFRFPPGLTVVADWRALQEKAITEVARWDDGEFQMFAVGEDDRQPHTDELRVVPFSTLVAADPGLEALYQTPAGASWWRADGASEWQRWRGWQDSS